jgi:hypothetical protein
MNKDIKTESEIIKSSQLWMILASAIMSGLPLLIAMLFYWFVCHVCHCESIYTKFNVKVNQSSLGLAVVLSLLFLYPIYKIWRQKGVDAFSGITIPVLILLILVFLRTLNDSYLFYDQRHHATLWIVTIPIIILTIYCSINLSDRENDWMMYGVAVTATLLTIVYLIYFREALFNGYVPRSIYNIKHLLTPLDRKLFLFGIFGPSMHSWILIPLAFWGMLSKRGYKTMLLWMPLYVVGVIGVIFGGTRSALLMSVIAQLSLLLLPELLKNKRRLICVIGYCLLVNFVLCKCVGTSSPDATAWGRLYTRSITVTSKIETGINQRDRTESSQCNKDGGISPNDHVASTQRKQNTTIDIVHQSLKKVEPRIAVWEHVLEQFKQSPIFGSSFLLIPIADDKNIERSKIKPGANPHSLILMMFLGTGIIGGVISLCIIFIGFKNAIITIRKTPKLAWVAAIFIAYTFVVCIGGNHYIFYAYWFWIPLGILHNNITKLRVKEQC